MTHWPVLTNSDPSVRMTLAKPLFLKNFAAAELSA